ncbi:BF3164 family lipoprotein [Marinoscillum sp.]|uniref:BF3164 family lipoprotein n=1 Tax=Marinoscillum sp. TaxID=2024838 RepID=UPI003BA8F4FE
MNLIGSCTNQPAREITFDSFTEKIEDLELRSRHDLQRFMSLPAMHLVGDYLVFYDVHLQNEELIDVYSKDSFEYLGSLVTRGGSETEITSPGFLTVALDNHSIWVTDNGKSQMVRYDLSLVNRDSVIHWSEVISYPPDTPILMGFAPTNNGQFIGQTFADTDSLLMQFDSDSKRYVASGYPSDDALVVGDAFSQFANVFCYLPNGNIALAYRHYDALQILNTEGLKLRTVIGPDKLKITGPRDKKAAYRHTKATENYLYAEYVGDEVINPETNSMNQARSLFIFDLDGNPVAEIDLGLTIANFAVDPETESLWIYTNDTENEPLLRYKWNENNL